MLDELASLVKQLDVSGGCPTSAQLGFGAWVQDFVAVLEGNSCQQSVVEFDRQVTAFTEALESAIV